MSTLWNWIASSCNLNPRRNEYYGRALRLSVDQAMDTQANVMSCSSHTLTFRSHTPTLSAPPPLPLLCHRQLPYLVARHLRRHKKHAVVRFTVPPPRRFVLR